MTEQPGNPTDPTQPDPAASSDAGAAPTPPPAAPGPPPVAVPCGAGRRWVARTTSTRPGPRSKAPTSSTSASSPQAWSPSSPAFMPFYTASASFGGFSISAHMVGLARLLRLVRRPARPGRCGAGRADPVRTWRCRVPVYQAAVGRLRPRVAVPDPRPVHHSRRGLHRLGRLAGVGCDTGRGFGYWLALLAVLAGLGLSVLRCASRTTTDHDRLTAPRRAPRARVRGFVASGFGDRAPPLLALPGCPPPRRWRPRRPTRVVRRSNAKPSCHGESVAALVQRRWRPLCVHMK